MTKQRQKTHQEMEDDEQMAYLDEWHQRHPSAATTAGLCLWACILIAVAAAAWAWLKQ